jgi:autoinducer 2-degrading protein
VTVVLVARWVAREGEEAAVAQAAASLVRAAREEPGCLLLEAHRDPEDPRVFLFYEHYTDEAALAAHAETEHFRRFALEGALPRLESRERALYVPWAI